VKGELDHVRDVGMFIGGTDDDSFDVQHFGTP
jgi:hypothetical protein